MSKGNCSLAVTVLCAALLLGACTSTAPAESNSSPAETTTFITTTTTTATATSSVSNTSITDAITTTTANKRGKALINIATIHQFPEYPTGCESVAAVMALRHAGENTSVANFIDHYLECSQKFYWQDGKFYGPSPYEYFLGDPRSENSYGCMAPVIKKALISFLGTAERVIDTSGQSLDALCKTYIDNNTPVLVWVSINMVAIADGRQWILPDGTTYTWPNNEHCMLLVGYDANKYYFNDPYTGRVVNYSRSIVESRYERLGKQSLVITK